MALATLKSLLTYLRLIENASEMKRRMPAYSTQRSLKEGLSEISKLASLDHAAFKDPQNIASVIGAQRFVMISGEPSVAAHVARIFDSSKVLLAVLIDSGNLDEGTAPKMGSHSGSPQPQTAAKSASANWAPSKAEPPGARGASNLQPETAPESLKPLLSGNLALTCRLLRVLFEHMLGFASQSSAQQGSAVLVNELAGSKEHGRSFLATAMFILGTEVDHENLIAFMLEQGLFGMQAFEHLLQNREYCDAFYTFRRLERAFAASPDEEEAQLRTRMDKFNAQFGGQPCGAKMFEADRHDKSSVDAHLAAMDLLEALALTPLRVSLSHSVAAASSNCVRSLQAIARHFVHFADGEETREQANHEIADHLLAFARQFSADAKVATLP